jgi:hypothetical protein
VETFIFVGLTGVLWVLCSDFERLVKDLFRPGGHKALFSGYNENERAPLASCNILSTPGNKSKPQTTYNDKHEVGDWVRQLQHNNNYLRRITIRHFMTAAASAPATI